MKKVFSFFALFAMWAGTLFLGGCSVVGVGQTASRDFIVGDFSSVNVSGSFSVEFSYAEEASVEIVMQENLFVFLDVTVTGGTLYVNPLRSFQTLPANRPRLYIQAPSLTGVRLSGSTRFESLDTIEEESFTLRTSGSSRVFLDLEVDTLSVTTTGSSTIHLNVDAYNLTINSSGSSNMDIDMDVINLLLTGSGSARFKFTGQAFNANFETSGSSRIDAFFLATRDSDINISGSGRIYIYVSNNLNVRARGSSGVRYMGNPQVTSNTRGSSSIQRYNPH